MNALKEIWMVLHKLLPFGFLDDCWEVFDDDLFSSKLNIHAVVDVGMCGQSNGDDHLR